MLVIPKKGGKLKIGVQASLGNKATRPYLQINQSKKGWRPFGGREPAQQVLNPEFKTQTHQK
jgi:hypothetical protein